jgi:Zn-dependent peptidase ImmA (M78 family)/DNA-binding XRE family transcriptional regulator
MKDLKKIIGNNIKNSIKELGYKQDFIAKQLNITRQTLNNYIKGTTLVDIEKLIKLSELLKRNMDYFYKNSFEFSNYLFRSDVRVEKNTKIKFEEKIRKYIELEKLIKKKTIPYMLEVYLDKCNEKFIESIARKLRRFWNIGLNDPIVNPINLLESNGIKVVQSEYIDNKLSGFSAFNDKIGYCIYINDRSTIERQLFTAIHELGHFIFHRNDYNKELISKSDEEKENIVNYFAGVFLVPGESLKNFCEENYFQKIDFKEVCYIKKHFHVSAECIITRLYQEKKINEDEYKKLREEANIVVGKKGEREPLNKEEFINNFRFKSLIKNAYLENKITTSKVASLMDLSVIESNRLAESWLSNGQMFQ